MSGHCMCAQVVQLDVNSNSAGANVSTPAQCCDACKQNAQVLPGFRHALCGSLVPMLVSPQAVNHRVARLFTSKFALTPPFLLLQCNIWSFCYPLPGNPQVTCIRLVICSVCCNLCVRRAFISIAELTWDAATAAPLPPSKTSVYAAFLEPVSFDVLNGDLHFRL